MGKELQQEIMRRLEEGTLDELNPGDSFTFSCTDECMGNCCRNIDIFLDPWDVETMARHLGIPGQEFVKAYCILELKQEAGWPGIQLKHVAEGPCTFMLDDGKCSVYPARPRNCRTAPVARAIRFQDNKGKKEMQERIFMIKPADSCRGFGVGKSWTVQEWLEDSNAYKYYELSDICLELADYATTTLNCRRWMSAPVMQMMVPFLFAPDLLRSKLGIKPDDVDNEEFYRRRMRALRLIITEMAAQMGFGPHSDSAGQGAKSLMEIAQEVLLSKKS